MKFGAPLAGRPIRLRTRFLVPVLVASLPLALFSAAVVFLLWQYQLDRLREGNVENARVLAIAVSADIESTRLHLQHLAMSPLLVSDSIAMFRLHCEKVSTIRTDWRHMVLIDKAGNRVFATSGPGRTQPMKIIQHPHIRAVFEERRPVLSDLFVTPDGETLISMVVPVMKDGEVAYILGAALKFDWFDALLKSHVGKSRASLLDGHFRFISRSVDANAFRGKSAEGALLNGVQRAVEARADRRTPAADVDENVWADIPGTTWKVAVAYPTPSLAGVFGQPIGIVAALGVVVLLAALGIAVQTSGRLRRAIELAAQRAEEVADGRQVVIPKTNTVELDLLNGALHNASEKIRQTEGERDRLLAREQQARVAAEQANRAKDEFLAMLGHELRNPIGAIGNCAMLLEVPSVTPDRHRFAREVIVRQTAHLTRLIDDLLDVGRVVSGKVRLQLEAMDLSASAQTAVASLTAAGKGVRHRFHFECDSVIAWADRTRLEQIIANLVANAINYSPEGTKITIATREEAGLAVLTVSDHGYGLGEDQLDRVFELFYQGQRNGHRSGGLGIGLTIVKRIVELHGGSIEAKSAGPGLGSTFTVRLPMPSGGASIGIVVTRHPPARALNVVLIEDNPDSRESLRMLIEFDGHTVCTAADGLEGLRRIVEMVPDVAIVDIDLPGIDGYEIVRRTRAGGHARIFMIAYTGYGQDDDIKRAAEAGFDAHLVKPADMQKLRALLASSRSTQCAESPTRRNVGS
jgi:signal transduction histidine kinase/CheY-like chemotaxis protein